MRYPTICKVVMMSTPNLRAVEAHLAVDKGIANRIKCESLRTYELKSETIRGDFSFVR